jgi:hypothetical protein
MKTDDTAGLDLDTLEELESDRAELDQMPFGETWRVATDNYKGRLFVYAPALVKAAKREAVANACPMTEDISALVERLKRAAEKVAPKDETYKAAHDYWGSLQHLTTHDQFIMVCRPASVLALCNAYQAAVRETELFSEQSNMFQDGYMKVVRERDALRARVAELEAERDKWKADGEDVAQMLVQRDKEADEALDVALSNMAEAQLHEQALSQRVSELESALETALVMAEEARPGSWILDEIRSVLRREAKAEKSSLLGGKGSPGIPAPIVEEF